MIPSKLLLVLRSALHSPQAPPRSPPATKAPEPSPSLLPPQPLAERGRHHLHLARHNRPRHLPARPPEEYRSLSNRDVRALVEENGSDAVDEVLAGPRLPARLFKRSLKFFERECQEGRVSVTPAIQPEGQM